jgi:hypothetical protein
MATRPRSRGGGRRFADLEGNDADQKKDGRRGGDIEGQYLDDERRPDVGA